VRPCVGGEAIIAILRPLDDATKYVFFVISRQGGVSNCFFENVSEMKEEFPPFSGKAQEDGVTRKVKALYHLPPVDFADVLPNSCVGL
jgi:hypothetical protein